MTASHRARAFIFDLDGTLVDSLRDIGASMNHALAAFGLPAHPLHRYRYFIGEGLEVLAERAVPAAKHPLIPELLAEYRRHYADHFADTTVPFPGIPELLDRLSALGCPLAILSNKRHDFTVRFAQTLLSRWSFQVVLGLRAGALAKPDPTSAREIAAALALPPGEIAFVGDTSIDMATARSAGMIAAGVLWGMRDLDELERGGAHRLVAHPLELLELL